MSVRAFAVSLVALPLALALALAAPARAESCDGLTIRLIRGTGASLVGRIGPRVVFRAADAERFSLDCARPPRLLFHAPVREPQGSYFVLIGLTARVLTGAPEDPVEALARQLHQDSLLTGLPQLGRVGGAVLRCDPGDRPDGFGAGTLCRVAADRSARTAPAQAGRPFPRRRAGLEPGA
ncbi:hypothetical protein [Methylobacterium sp. Leaf118]|uniref:hypothetical protein n=1 Tax=Methylobacterium sp. Leaf118 TaxID=2876562 RepID=UPI001E40EAB6|nr:hypothetical protein [Methylobacterium sp. Leaf118]